MFKFVTKFFPDHDWKIYQFKTPNGSSYYLEYWCNLIPFFESSLTRQGFWEDEKNVYEALEWVAKKLNIKSDNDWYRVSNEEMVRLGCGYLIKKYGGLV